MTQPERKSGCAAALVIVLLLVLVLVVIAGTGAYVVWQRQQIVVEQVAAREAQEAAMRAAEVAASQEAFERQQKQSDQPDVGQGENGAATVETAVRNVLARQQAAWNAGDVDAFMRGYWNSEELSFSSGGTTTRGWQATLDGYHTRYPSLAAMGQLTFGELEVTPLGDDAALVLGQWSLARAPNDDAANEDSASGETLEDVGGNFTLVFRRIDGQWVIVHDHTSRAEADTR